MPLISYPASVHSHPVLCYPGVSCPLNSVRSLVRILKDLQRHVPGLSHLNSWYIELLVRHMF